MNQHDFGRRSRVWTAGLALLAVAVVGGSLWAGSRLSDSTHQDDQLSTQQKAEVGTRYADTLSTAFREASERVLPAVVMIETRPKFAAAHGSERRLPRGGRNLIGNSTSATRRSATSSNSILNCAAFSMRRTAIRDPTICLPGCGWRRSATTVTSPA